MELTVSIQQQEVIKFNGALTQCKQLTIAKRTSKLNMNY